MPRNLWIVLLLAGLYLCAGSLSAAPQQRNVSYPVSGKVIDKKSRQPVAYANVFVNGLPGKGASTDSLGMFEPGEGQRLYEEAQAVSETEGPEKAAPIYRRAADAGESRAHASSTASTARADSRRAHGMGRAG